MALAQRIGQEFKALRDNELTQKVDKEVGKGLSTEDYTTAEKTKLASIEPSATADQTGAEIKVLYEGELDTNAFTDAEKAKLLGIEEGAQVNVADTLTTLVLVGNILTYTDEDGGVHNFDLSLYLDDTNLARIVSGSYDEATNSIIFERDDLSTFSVDITAFLGDTDFQSAISGNVDVAANTAARHTHTNKALLDVIDQNLSTTDSVVFADTTIGSSQYAGGTGTQGTVSWNIDEETLSLIQNDNTLELGQETLVHCRNTTISTITAGTVVMASGTVGASGRITIEPMGTTSNLVSRIVGIVPHDISSGADGKVSAFGKIKNLDTSMWLEGDILYVDTTTPGALTNVKPTSEMVLPVAFVITSHASAGVIMTRITPINELFNEGAATWGQIGGTLSDQIDLQGELDAKQDNLTFDSVPTSASTNPVESGGVFTALSTKQDNLTFDSVPVNLSTNPVTSNGIYNADLSILASAQTYTDTELLNYDLSTVVDSKDTTTLNSANTYTDNELLSYTPTTTLTTLLAAKASLNSDVSFNNITPQTTNIYNLGSSLLRYNEAHINTLIPRNVVGDDDAVYLSGTRFTSFIISTDKSNAANSDPVLVLRDDATTNEWSLRNDTSAGDICDFRYNNSTKMRLNTVGDLDLSGGAIIDGFTTHGVGAPAIKTKKLTGTTAATEGGSVTVAHGLTGGKIISFTLKIEQGTDQGVPAQFTGVAGYEASIFHNSTVFTIENITANSANILSKNFIIYVTYEA